MMARMMTMRIRPQNANPPGKRSPRSRIQCQCAMPVPCFPVLFGDRYLCTGTSMSSSSFQYDRYMTRFPVRSGSTALPHQQIAALNVGPIGPGGRNGHGIKPNRLAANDALPAPQRHDVGRVGHFLERGVVRAHAPSPRQFHALVLQPRENAPTSPPARANPNVPTAGAPVIGRGVLIHGYGQQRATTTRSRSPKPR